MLAGGHKANGNKIMLEQASNPFGIFLVSFLSTDSLNITDTLAVVFEQPL